MATDLDSHIRERLAGFGCCEGYRNPDLDRARAAITAVLGCHPTSFEVENEHTFDANGSYRMTRPKLVGRCLACDQPAPCREVRLIAVALGLEADADG